MEIKIEKTEKNKKEIEITIPNPDMEAKFLESYKKYRKDIAIKGFRKGKVPINLIKSLFGSQIQEQVINDTVNEAIKEAITEKEIRAISSPDIKDVSYKPETGLIFKAQMEVAPEIETLNYKGLEFEKEIYQVEDSDVEESLEQIRRERAIINSVDGEVQEGHFVVADLQRVDSNRIPIIGDKLENKMLHINHSDENEFALPLIGAKVGDKRILSISTNLPDQSENETKEEYYEAIIKEIKERILPELDDSFIKSVGDFENLDVLKAQIKENLIIETGELSKQKFNRMLADEVVKCNPLDLPEIMINNYLEILVENLKKNSEKEIDETIIRQRYRVDAIWDIKWRLMKERIAELENLGINETDFDEYFKETSESEKIDEAKLRDQYSSNEAKSHLKSQLYEEKILKVIADNSNISEKTVPYKELFTLGMTNE